MNKTAHRRSTTVARLSSSILLLAYGASALPDAQPTKAQKRTDQTIAALAQMTDADSVAAAGLMSIGSHGAQSLDFLALATAEAPDRADLLWLQAMRCSGLKPCDPTPVEQRLREVDPTNGAGWWPAMARA